MVLDHNTCFLGTDKNKSDAIFMRPLSVIANVLPEPWECLLDVLFVPFPRLWVYHCTLFSLTSLYIMMLCSVFF